MSRAALPGHPNRLLLKPEVALTAPLEGQLWQAMSTCSRYAIGFTSDDSSLNDAHPISSDASDRELTVITQSSVHRAGEIFTALGSTLVSSPPASNPSVHVEGRSGNLSWSIALGELSDKIASQLPGGRNLGQAKQVATSVVEEELIHTAWLAGIRDQVIESGPVAPSSIVAGIYATESEPELAQFMQGACNA